MRQPAERDQGADTERPVDLAALGQKATRRARRAAQRPPSWPS